MAGTVLRQEARDAKAPKKKKWEALSGYHFIFNSKMREMKVLQDLSKSAIRVIERTYVNG